MPSVLDLSTWPRRAAFEHFRQLGHPYFSLCARLDVTALPARVTRHAGATRFLAYHHAALCAVNGVEALRLRLQEGQVFVHEAVDGSTTVLRDDQTLGFVDLPFEADFDRFVAGALPLLAAAKRPRPELGFSTSPRAQIHMTTIPWLDFTSFSHARDAGGADSVPKLAFGKMVAEPGGRLSMSVALEVHHALVDGLHVGQFYEALQTELNA